MSPLVAARWKKTCPLLVSPALNVPGARSLPHPSPAAPNALVTLAAREAVGGAS
jgi:hypothetical protein